VGGRTPGENNAIEGVRFSAAMGANDPDTMARSFEVLKAKLGGPQQLQYMEAIAGTYLRGGNAAKTLEWANKYFAAGGSSAAVKQMQQQAQFKSGDMTAVLKDTLAEVQGRGDGAYRLGLGSRATGERERGAAKWCCQAGANECGSCWLIRVH